MYNFLITLAMFFCGFIFSSCERNISYPELEGDYVFVYTFPDKFSEKSKKIRFKLLPKGVVEFYDIDLASILGDDMYNSRNIYLNNYAGLWRYNENEGEIFLEIDDVHFKKKNKEYINKRFPGTLTSWKVDRTRGDKIIIFVLDCNEDTFSIFEKYK